MRSSSLNGRGPARALIMLLCALAIGCVSLPLGQARAEKWQTTPSGWWWLTSASVDDVKDRIDAGFRIIDLEVVQASPLRFAAAFVKNSGVHAKAWWWYHGQTAAQVADLIDENDGRLIDLERYETGGQVRYAVVMVHNAGADAKAWWYYRTVSADFIDDKLDEHNARLVDINTYVAGGTRYYDAIMIRNAGADASAWWWYYNVSPDFISDKLDEHGARLIDIERHGDGTFTVIMERNTGKAWWWYYGVTAAQLNDYADQHGARIFEVERYEVGGQTRYAALMLNNSNTLTSEVRDLTDAKVDGGGFGFYLKRVSGSVLAAIRPDDSYYPASSIKVLHHLHAMRWVAAGIPPNAPNPLVKLSVAVPLHLSDSCGNTGPAAGEPLSAALSAMLMQSDNNRTNGIQDFFGQAAIDDTAHDIVGMSAGTRLSSKFGSPCGGPGAAQPNRLTLRDIGLLYERVAKGELLSPLYLSSFHDLMRDEGDANFLSSLVSEEAAEVGLSASQLQEFSDELRLMYKDGSWTSGTPKRWSTISGWVELPFRSGGQIVRKGYVYGAFIDEADGIAEGFGASTMVEELLRDQVRSAMYSWKSAVGTAQPGQPFSGQSGDGVVHIALPAGAVSAPTSITHVPLRAPTAPAADGSVWLYGFSLEAFGEGGAEVTQFGKDMTYTIAYPAEALRRAGRTPASLRLAYWDEAAEEWATVPSELDAADGRLTARLDHFTEFAVFSDLEARVYLPMVRR